MRRTIFCLVTALLALTLHGPAAGQVLTGSSSFDGTAAIAPGDGEFGDDAIRITSQGVLPIPNLTYGNVYWTPQTPIYFSQLTKLEARFKGESGMIAGGSPRFTLYFDWNDNGLLDPVYETDGLSHLFGLWGGESGNFQTNFTGGWQSTVNFVDSAINQNFWEVIQLRASGAVPPYADYNDALASAVKTQAINDVNVWFDPDLSAGATIGDVLNRVRILQIAVAVDGGWAIAPGNGSVAQEILLQSVLIEGYTPDTEEGGGTSFTGNAFGPLQGTNNDAPLGYVAFSELLVANVPEPASLALLGVGGALLLARRRKA